MAAMAVTCDQVIFFFFGVGKFPPAKKKKSPDRRLRECNVKLELELFYTLSLLLHLAQFVKCCGFF